MLGLTPNVGKKSVKIWREIRFIIVNVIAFSHTSKCMHGMNQTEAEYSRRGKRSQRASLSQIGPVVLEE